MRRILFVIFLFFAVASPAFAADGRFTVMMLLFRGITPAEQGFMDYLKERLPVDFVIRDAEGKGARIAEHVAEAKRLRPDLIYAFGTSVTLAAVGAEGKIDPARHITDIPVVFNIVADPIGSGLAKAFLPTGRNLTGVSHLVPIPDQIKTIRRFKPVKLVGVIYNPHEANSMLSVEELRRMAIEFEFGMTEAPLQIPRGQQPTAQDIETAMAALLAVKPDIVYLPSDSSLIRQAAVITEVALNADIAVFSATEDPVRKAGALAGLVSNYYNAGTFAAHKAEQILRKSTTAEKTPIETLQRFSLVVNMRAARRLGIFPPMDLIKIAELLK